jgi:hypothetical protein
VQAGTYTVTASYAGDSDYNSATATGIINVLKADETLSFGLLSNHTYGDPDFALGATASSGLAVSYTATGSASIVTDASGASYVHITGAGSATITAHQAGNSSCTFRMPGLPAARAARSRGLWAKARKSSRVGRPDRTASISARRISRCRARRLSGGTTRDSGLCRVWPTGRDAAEEAWRDLGVTTPDDFCRVCSSPHPGVQLGRSFSPLRR